MSRLPVLRARRRGRSLPHPSRLARAIARAPFLVTFFLIALFSVPASPEPGMGGGTKPLAPHVEGELLVKFRRGTQPSEKRSTRKLVRGRGLRRFRTGAEQWRIDPQLTTEQAVILLQQDPRVEYAEPNYLIHLETAPDDLLYPDLWSLDNTGEQGLSGADIDAEEAWDLSTGDSSVVVAVIDSGMSYNHPDLSANLWVNRGEIANNGIDDDGNGYIDDVHGWDFVNGDNSSRDDINHGSHVSGIIGAHGDNEVGVCGVNWRVSLVPLKAFNSGGFGTHADIIRALEYAASIRARVINASWGGESFSMALLDAIESAGAAGGLFVAAAGNSSRNSDLEPFYPAAYDSPYIISVAATDSFDRLAYFSNFGRQTIDLGAPGSRILSADRGSGYIVLSGTSMAAPHVTGVAALYMSMRPLASPLVVKQAILDGTDPIPDLEGNTVTGGRLNAYRTLPPPDTAPPGAITDLVAEEVGSTSITLGWTATGSDGPQGRAVFYDLRWSEDSILKRSFDAAIPVTGLPEPAAAGERETFDVGGLDPGRTYYFGVRAIDEAGNAGPVTSEAVETTLPPPTLAVSPSFQSLALHAGERATRILSIRNAGQGRLDWSLDTSTGGGMGPAPVALHAPAKGEMDTREGREPPRGKGGADGRGYRFIDGSHAGGPGFSWADISVTGTPVRSLTGDDQVSEPIHLGFPMPFYGREFDAIRVSTDGWLSFTVDQSSPIHEPLPSIRAPETLIAPLWTDLDFQGVARVTYVRAWDHLTIQYTDVPRRDGTGRYTFQVILHDDGRILFEYLAVSGDAANATIGVQGASGQDGLLVSFNAPYVHDGAAVEIQPPVSWLSSRRVQGRLRSGERDDVTLDIDTFGLQEGTYTGFVHLATNDPDQPLETLELVLEVTDAPAIDVAPGELEFGEMFAGYPAVRPLSIMNRGTLDLNVSRIGSSDPAVTVSPTSLVVAPGASEEISVAVSPTSPGSLCSTLVIESDAPAHPVRAARRTPKGESRFQAHPRAETACNGKGRGERRATARGGCPGCVPVLISATVAARPSIQAIPSALSQELVTGQRASRTVTLVNMGAVDLTVSVSADPSPATAGPGGLYASAWLSVSPPSATIPAGQSRDFDVTLDAEGLGTSRYLGALIIEPADPAEPTLRIPALIAVLGAPSIVLEGPEIRRESRLSFSSAGSGASTHHALAIGAAPQRGGRIEVLAEGAYGVPSGSATVTAEGIELGTLADPGKGCLEMAGTFPVPRGLLSSLAADGVVNVVIQNSAAVDPVCQANRHTVRLVYRNPLESIDFGTVPVGDKASLSFGVANAGPDPLVVTSIASDRKAFNSTLGRFTVAPGSSQEVPITFAPGKPGAISATISVKSDDPDSPSAAFSVKGVGTKRPVASVSPASLGVELSSGQEATMILTLSNDGDAPLDFELGGGIGPPLTAACRVQDLLVTDRASGALYDVDVATGSVRRIDVRLSGTGVGVALDDSGTIAYLTEFDADAIRSVDRATGDADLLLSGIYHPVGIVLASRDSVAYVTSGPAILDRPGLPHVPLTLRGNLFRIDLVTGEQLMFEARVYDPHGLVLDRSESTAYIAEGETGRIVAVDLVTDESWWPVENLEGPVDIALDPSLRRAYVAEAGAERISLVDLQSGRKSTVAVLTGRPGGLKLDPGGTVLFVTERELGRVSAVDIPSGKVTPIASGLADPTGITYSLPPGCGRGGFLAAVPTSGSVPPHGALPIEVHLNGRGLDAADYGADLQIRTNDPKLREMIVPVSLHLMGSPAIGIEPALGILDLGQIFAGQTAVRSIHVRNEGSDRLEVSTIVSNLPGFNATPSSFGLEPRSVQNVVVAFAPQGPGAFQDLLSIFSNDPGQPVLRVPIAALAASPAVIGVSPASIDSTLALGESETTVLGLSNLALGGAGASDLNVSLHQIPPRHVPADIELLSPSPAPLTCILGDPVSGSIYAQRNGGTEFYRYDASSDSWEALAPSPISSAEGGCGAALLGGKIYAAYPGSRYLLGAYDIVTDSWSLVENPLGLGTGNITSDGTRYLYLLIETRFLRFEPGSREVKLMRSPPFRFRARGGLQYLEGRIYGHDGNGLRRVGFYDIASTSWTVLPDTSQRPTLGSAVDPGNRTFFVHGTDRYPGLYAYDIEQGVWEITKLPFADIGNGGMAWLPSPSPSLFIAQGSGNGFARRITGRSILQLDPAWGRLPPGGGLDVSVTIDASGLDVGMHETRIILQSDDPSAPRRVIPVNVTVLPGPRIVIQGQKVQIPSLQVFHSKTTSTMHVLRPSDPPEGDVTLTLRAEGDFGSRNETATVVVEGLILGSVGGTGQDCNRASGSFTISAADFGAFAADGVVNVRVQNSAGVDVICPNNWHIIELAYSLAHDPLAFGDVDIGSEISLGFRIMNGGTEQLVASIASPSADVSVSPDSVSLDPDKFALVTVRFRPSAAGSLTGALIITSNDPSHPEVMVNLSGAGVVP